MLKVLGQPTRWVDKRSAWMVFILLLCACFARAGDPLGATLQKDGTTTFRVWAPFVESVSVKVNGGNPVL